MEERIQNLLKKKDPGAWHGSILNHVKSLVSRSASDMAKYHARWDRNWEIYKSRRDFDEKDRKAAEQNEPTKMVLPLTYAQVETFISYGLDLLEQRPTLFELRGRNLEGHKHARVAEALLERDIDENGPKLLLTQLLRSMALCNIAVTKTSWREDTELQWQKVQQQENPASLALGFPSQPGPDEYEQIEVPSYQGNDIMLVSPYRFFPDTRLPLFRYQEGEFCASEDEETHMTLKKLEADGIVAGIDHIGSFKDEAWRTRASNRFSFNDANFGQNTKRGGQNIKPAYIRTCVQLDLIPSKFELEDGKPLGDSDRPERWLCEYANDKRIIRLEPFYYPHGRFTYSLAQFTPDQHELLSESLADYIHYLQSVGTFLVNSHVTSQRKIIDNRFVGDASALHMEDFQKKRPFIRVKKTHGGRDVRTILQQLQIQDVTGNNMTEVSAINSLMQTVTGISPNLAGAFSSGRRSAAEANTVNSSGLTRLRTHIGIFFEQWGGETCRQMLANLREGLTVETYVKIVGDGPYEMEAAEPFLAVDRDAISGQYAFEKFEGTSPSEKTDRAFTLQEIVLAFLNNPETLAVTGYDINKLIREIFLLRGIRNPERFKIDTAPQPAAEQGANPAGGGLAGGSLAPLQSVGNIGELDFTQLLTNQGQ